MKGFLRMHWRYAKYVFRHKWFVLVQCWHLGVLWRGLTHDLSKFLPGEWFPYAEFFYGGPQNPATRAAFDRAWLSHQRRNLHHWQAWRLRQDDGDTKLLPMPEKYVREMLADWRGASRALGYPSIAPWFTKNKDHIELAPQTWSLLQNLMTSPELYSPAPEQEEQIVPKKQKTNHRPHRKARAKARNKARAKAHTRAKQS